MSLPLLDFLITKGIYETAELEQGKLEVLFSTNMVDLAVDIYTARKEKPPAEMLARREEVVATMNALSAEVQPILELAIGGLKALPDAAVLIAQAALVQGALDHMLDQRRIGHWLDQIILGSGAQGLHGFTHVHTGGHDYDRGIRHRGDRVQY